MEKIMEEGKFQRQRASVPAFGEWDQMKAGGVLPDYSMDFTKIRAARMQRKSMPSVWSSAGSPPEVVGGDDDERNNVSRSPSTGTMIVATATTVASTATAPTSAGRSGRNVEQKHPRGGAK